MQFAQEYAQTGTIERKRLWHMVSEVTRGVPIGVRQRHPQLDTVEDRGRSRRYLGVADARARRHEVHLAGPYERVHTSAIAVLDLAQTTTDAIGAVAWMKKHEAAKVGVVGFCWGGGASNDLAVAAPDLGAAVAYYGRQPKTAEDVAKIKAPLLLHYAGMDDRINAGEPYIFLGAARPR